MRWDCGPDPPAPAGRLALFSVACRGLRKLQALVRLDCGPMVFHQYPDWCWPFVSRDRRHY